MMRRGFKALKLIYPLLLLVIICSCSEESLNQKIPVLEQGVADEYSEGVQLAEYRNERLDYIIEAKSMERFTDRRMLYGYIVTLTSYDKEGQVSSVIKADTTVVDDARNVVIASGSVSFKTKDGDIKTQKMYWDRNVDEIIVPTQLTLTRMGDALRGENLRTNTKLSFAEMNTVTAEGYFDEEDFVDW
ncbi:MAG: LPS export ABC transporter periplasmic protein LptC [Candidatus Cloacimonetes bacterium]|jgi:LPS export ABC transporter protein LptC|nr:LPS export ABC transporter periplasmic protein LptC [Candidatus Cloacimonadota bacterium]MDD2505709.1 LPS export ABC transporter periplasmic protein LptC [Candidatus Cloacimonadota bacterium]MDD4559131.1 LPS export ABC transporter periplasmic protein LptC [Candidatus Cloacimonadota bacterium]